MGGVQLRGLLLIISISLFQSPYSFTPKNPIQYMLWNGTEQQQGRVATVQKSLNDLLQIQCGEITSLNQVILQ
jgi:hypothetical protein